MNTTSRTTLRDVAAHLNQGSQAVRADSLVRDNSMMASAITKMVVDPRGQGYDNKGQLAKRALDQNSVSQVLDSVAGNTADTETAMQLLPDMKWASQILIAAILSPKDMGPANLNYRAPSDLPPEVSTPLVSILRKHFDNDYKIKPLLPTILQHMLAKTGSYPLVVLPENTIDDIINGDSTSTVSLESMSDVFGSDGNLRPLGILGSTAAVTQDRSLKSTLESFNSNQHGVTAKDLEIRLYDGANESLNDELGKITVTDNPNVLKLPGLQEVMRARRYNANFNRMVTESRNERRAKTSITDRELSSLLHRNRHYDYMPMMSIKPQDQLNRRSIGAPVVLHIPSDSIMPVFPPGNPSKHLGYIVILDEEGHFLTKTSRQDYYAQMQTRLYNNTNFASAMLAKVKNNMTGFDMGNRQHYNNLTNAFQNIIDENLYNCFRNGLIGGNVQIGNWEETARIMMARTFMKKHTQILFIPKELMTYFALDYDENGVGKSLVQDIKVLTSLRAMLMFSNIMSAVKNSVGRTEIKVQIDEDDPDPYKTLERVRDRLMRARQQGFPLGANNPVDIVDFLARASLEIIPTGNAGLPDMAIDFGEKSSAYQKPDTDLDETLRKLTAMHFCVPPETVENTDKTEFATSIVTNNILLARQVMVIQDQLHPLLNHHLRMEVMANEGLMSELEEVLENAKDKVYKHFIKDRGLEGKEVEGLNPEAVIKHILMEFVSGFEVSLPRPESVTLKQQIELLKDYKSALDESLDFWISTEFINNESIGDVSKHTDTVKAMVKGIYVRRFMSENSILPELGELVATDRNGEPVLDVYKVSVEYIESMGRTFSSVFTKLLPTIRVLNAKEKKLEDQNNGEGNGAEGGSSSSSSSSSSSDDFGGGSDDFGSSDSGFGDDGFGGDDNSSDNFGNDTGNSDDGNDDTSDTTSDNTTNTEDEQDQNTTQDEENNQSEGNQSEEEQSEPTPPAPSQPTSETEPKPEEDNKPEDDKNTDKKDE